MRQILLYGHKELLQMFPYPVYFQSQMPLQTWVWILVILVMTLGLSMDIQIYDVGPYSFFPCKSPAQTWSTSEQSAWWKPMDFQCHTWQLNITMPDYIWLFCLVFSLWEHRIESRCSWEAFENTVLSREASESTAFHYILENTLCITFGNTVFTKAVMHTTQAISAFRYTGCTLCRNRLYVNIPT